MISANAALPGSYDYSEVARSVFIAIAASYAALDLAGRVSAASGRVRLSWLSGGATAMGIGIWAMHIKGMLAFDLPVPQQYYWPLVLVSLLVAILASAVGLYVASRRKMGWVEALSGSVIMSGGIAGMHYIGMASMRLPAITRYSPLLVALSVLFAFIFSLVALLIAFDLREETRWTVPRRLGSAMVMGAAVCAMHYTGMAAASFIPASPPDLSHAVSISALANNGIVMVTLIVLVAAVVTASVDMRAGAESRRLNEDLEHRVAERTLQLEAVNQALRREIAERERAEEDVRRSEDRLRLVIDTLPALVWSKLPDGSADFLNQRFREYTGLSVEEGLGWGWMMKAFHPEDRAQEEWRAAFAAGQPFEKEVRLRRADGAYRWFLLRAVPLYDEQGKVVKWYGTTTDIEDRRRAEDELRKQKEVFQKIVENIPVMIVLMGRGGRHELVNREWERTIGWTLAEIQEQNLDIFAEAFPDPQYRQTVKDLMAASTGEWADFKVRVRDGRVIDTTATFVNLSDGASIAIGRDITEQKRTEAALQEARDKLAHVTRTQAMGELAAAIAHEVNQPLTAIVTNANFSLRQLKGSTPNLEELRTAITEIVNDGTRASAVILRIRGSLMKGAPRRTELDINEVTQQAATLVRSELTRNRVSLRTDLAVDLPRVPGDPVQLQQVLINLIMNAIEAMRSSTARTRELLIRSATHRDGVLVQVQDSGPGVEPELRDRIFEPFFTTKAEGIGMGLLICRSIIESHGGRLSLVPDSEGTLFQFTLPVEPNGAS
jgi:PAS domain S-box-containing protein